LGRVVKADGTKIRTLRIIIEDQETRRRILKNASTLKDNI